MRFHWDCSESCRKHVRGRAKNITFCIPSLNLLPQTVLLFIFWIYSPRYLVLFYSFCNIMLVSFFPLFSSHLVWVVVEMWSAYSRVHVMQIPASEVINQPLYCCVHSETMKILKPFCFAQWSPDEKIIDDHFESNKAVYA